MKRHRQASGPRRATRAAGHAAAACPSVLPVHCQQRWDVVFVCSRWRGRDGAMRAFEGRTRATGQELQGCSQHKM